jgi:hypothetical protein
MATPFPRDSLAFPLAAARWAAAGALVAGAFHLVLVLRRFMDEFGLADLLRDLLPGMVGQTLLAAVLVGVLTFVVATHRQDRSPDRVGHAAAAAATTGLLAAFGASAATSAMSALAHGGLPMLQSPGGFAAIGVMVSVLHIGVAALGASVGAALLAQPGEPPVPTTPSRHAWAGIAVFGATLAFGVDLVLGALPGLLHAVFDADVFGGAPWTPVVAMAIGATSAAGYAWQRRRAMTALPWSGDAWTALASLPLALLLAAGLGVALGVLGYLADDGDAPTRLMLMLGLLVVAGPAFGSLGALAGVVRRRQAARSN